MSLHEPHARWGLLGLAVCTLLAIVGATLSSRRRGAVGLALSAVDHRSHGVEHLVSVYKRTYFSTDPFHDGEFLQDVLGMNVVTSMTTSQVDASTQETTTCAKREVLSTLDNFQLHFFHSFVSPGYESTEAWVRAWANENEEITSDNWNVWSVPSLTLYSPWIAPFVKQLERKNITHMRFQQTHHVTMEPLYSVLVLIPSSGLTVEIVSDEPLSTLEAVSEDGSFVAASFEALVPRMCPFSLQMQQDPRQLRAQHASLGGRIANAHGLPDLLTVSMALPTTEPVHFSEFFDTVLGALGIFPVGEHVTSDRCEVWQAELAITLVVNETVVTNPVYFKAVANTGARVGNASRTLAMLEAEVNRSRHAHMSVPNEGWDSFLDMHPGLHVNTLLDGAPAVMADHGLQYTMHAECVGCNSGSIWSSGIAPWSMEIQGTFAKDENIRKSSLIDYCSPTSNGDTRQNVDDISYGLVGRA